MGIQRVAGLGYAGANQLSGLAPVEALGGTGTLIVLTQSIDLASAAAATSASQATTVTGVAVGDIPLAVLPAEGILTNINVTALGPALAANTLQLRVCNPTAVAIDAAAVVFTFFILRP